MNRLTLLQVLVAGCVLLLSSHAVYAQGVGEARYGQRYKSMGLVTQPGLIFDEDAPPTADHKERMPVMGSLVVFSLHHILHPHLMMGAELGAGLIWLDEHTVSPRGVAASEKAFAWQAALLGRFLPMEDVQGLSFAGGLHLYGARLNDAPLQQLALDLRTGWMFWRGERSPQFAMIELGVGVPVVQGLRLPLEQQVVLIDGQEPVQVEPSNWSLWRSSLTLQVSF